MVQRILPIVRAKVIVGPTTVDHFDIERARGNADF